MQKIIVTCKYCGYSLNTSASYKYKSCPCGRVTVDCGKVMSQGLKDYTRIVGNREDYKITVYE